LTRGIFIGQILTTKEQDVQWKENEDSSHEDILPSKTTLELLYYRERYLGWNEESRGKAVVNRLAT